MSDFVLFSGNGGTGCKTPASPGYGIILGSSTTVNEGSIGSNKLIQSTGSTTLGISPLLCNLFSKGTVVLTTNNKVTGRITAANSPSVSGTILSVGTGANLGGNIDVNGKIIIGGGTVSGKVTYPSPASNYSGPVPGGGNNTGGTLTLPTFPSLPPVTSFPAYGATNISSTTTISPGAYGSLTLGGNKTLTLSGPGIYVFKSFSTSGPNSSIVFDFKNTTAGNFIIYVYGDVLLDKMSASMVNGGNASRIYTETHGTGSTCASDKTISFNVTNGSNGTGNTSLWLGTVWAPYAGIKIGSPTGPSTVIKGALWSGTQVNIQSGVNIIYVPYSDCTPPDAQAGEDKPLNFVGTTILTGKSNTSSVSYNWQAINGGVIESPANAASVSVSAAGTYILTVSKINQEGCAATDTVIVTSKVNNLIGSELSSLYQNYPPSDTDNDLFIIQSDSVVIDIIVNQGKRDSVLALVRDTAYGLTRERPTGGSDFLITGLYPIKKLLLLNLKPTLINFCRPHYGALGGGLGIAYTLGDKAIRTDFIRNGYPGIMGDSVRIGVISDSYNTIPGNPAAADTSAGDLPSGSADEVKVQQEYPYGIAGDEGRAMLQIIHDIAPKSKLVFRTGFITPGDMSDAIRKLKYDDSCDVIVDDVTHITEPFLNDGAIARAVNEVSGGTKPVAYFTAAGNFANKSYQNNFVPVAPPSGLTGNVHKFGDLPGGVADIYQRVKLKKGPQTIVLQWQDSIYSLGQTQTGGTRNDLDIYLTGNNGITLFGYNRNNIGGDPIETLPFYAAKDTVLDILIVRASGTSANLSIKYIIFRGEDSIMEYQNQGNSTIVGQANTDSAFTIGAVRYSKTPQFGVNPPEFESFTSYGGTVTDGVKRNKPDFMGPDGVSTTVNFFGSFNFFGTSAAAPHAAAAAALLMQARKRYYNDILKPWALRDILKNSALDMSVPGRDSVSGYGLIRADIAIQSFAAATPDLIRLTPIRTTVPGTDTLTVLITGNYLSRDNTKVYLRDTTTALPTVILTDSTGYALIPAFGVANPPIFAYTSSITPSRIDGGPSDSLYFFTPERKQVKIKAVDTSIKYGDSIPYSLFRSQIYINDTLIQNLTHPLTPGDIGLGGNAITYTTNATDTSSANRYAITPVISRAFNTNNPVDQGLLELYKYEQPATHNPNGILTITQMPVVITPNDYSVVYGKTIPEVGFKYEYDESAIDPNKRASFLTKIKEEHQSQIAQKTFVFIDDSAVLNGRRLDSTDLTNLSFLVSGRSVVVSGRSVVANGRSVVVNGRSVVVSGRSVVANSTPVYDTTDVVDLDLGTIFNYQVNNDTVPLVNGRSVVASRALASGRSVVVNGRSVVALSTIVNGRSVVALSTIVNSEGSSDQDENNVAAILDSADVWASAGDSINLKSVNAITGLTSGRHFIVPASYISGNCKITYGLGRLDIKKDTLIVKARDTGITYGVPQPAYTSAITGYDYNDSAGSVIKSGPTYSLQNMNSSIVPAGTYTIVPDNLKQYSPENYYVKYQTGTLTVGKPQLTATAVDTSRVYGNANPVFRIAYSGFVNNEGESNITAPVAGTNATPLSAVGDSVITLTGGVATNYTLVRTPGKLTITKAPLTVTADLKYIDQGSSLPTFTSTYTGLKNNDITKIASLKYTLSPSCTGAAGVYSIIPSALSFSPASTINNYSVTYVPGLLYINPKSKNAKNVKPTLDCVDTLINDPGGYKYLARFSYQNPNPTPVYVPIGTNNNITALGPYSGVQPQVFLPAGGKFDIKFTGAKMTWILNTYNGTQKTSSSSYASSTSNKCNNGSLRPAAGNISALAETAKVNDIIVYPNPVSNKLVVMFPASVTVRNEISISDVLGKNYQLKSIQKNTNGSLVFDMSGFRKGVYYVKISSGLGRKVFKIIKL